MASAIENLVDAHTSTFEKLEFLPNEKDPSIVVNMEDNFQKIENIVEKNLDIFYQKMEAFLWKLKN